MTQEQAIAIIKEKNLRWYCLFDDDRCAFHTYILKQDGKYIVYGTGERAERIGGSEFDDESAAWDKFVDLTIYNNKLRTRQWDGNRFLD